MKVKKTESLEVFKPVSIEITFETHEELLEFYCIFNFTPISMAAPCLDFELIRDSLGNPSYCTEFERFKREVRKRI